VTVSGIAAALWLVVIVFIAIRVMRRRGRRVHAGPGAMGSVYDLLNADKRKAIEIIVEEKAEERRPEYPDGILPDLEDPKRAPR
jgi:hypothetical protein